MNKTVKCLKYDLRVRKDAVYSKKIDKLSKKRQMNNYCIDALRYLISITDGNKLEQKQFYPSYKLANRSSKEIKLVSLRLYTDKDKDIIEYIKIAYKKYHSFSFNNFVNQALIEYYDYEKQHHSKSKNSKN